MQRVLRKVLKFLVFRYVDDSFSAGRWGVRLDMTLVLDIIAAAFGLPTDPRKTDRLTEAMVVLGMKVTLCWERRFMIVSLPLEKANSWKMIMQEALRTGLLPAAMAEK